MKGRTDGWEDRWTRDTGSRQHPRPGPLKPTPSPHLAPPPLPSSLGPAGFPLEARRGQPKASLHCPSRPWSHWAGREIRAKGRGPCSSGTAALCLPCDRREEGDARAPRVGSRDTRAHPEGPRPSQQGPGALRGPLLRQGRTHHGLGSRGSESPVIPLPLPQDGEASAFLLGRTGAALGFVTCGPAPTSRGAQKGPESWGGARGRELGRQAGPRAQDSLSRALPSAPASRNKAMAAAGEEGAQRRRERERQSQKREEKPRGAHKGAS